MGCNNSTSAQANDPTKKGPNEPSSRPDMVIDINESLDSQIDQQLNQM